MNVEPGTVDGGSTVCGWASRPTGICLLGSALIGLLLLGFQGVWAVTTSGNGLIVALDGELQLLDPYAHHYKLNAIIDWLVHDQLFFRDPKTLRPVPNLAESLKATDDLTWEIKLRPHLRFHNGEPVDAAAVKFTLDRLLQSEPKFPSQPVFVWIKDVEIVDDLTVRLHVHRPVPSVPDVLTRLHVLPPRYMSEIGEDKFGEAPVGAGPYRFVSRKPGGPLTLRANDEYWGGGRKADLPSGR